MAPATFVDEENLNRRKMPSEPLRSLEDEVHTAEMPYKEKISGEYQRKSDGRISLGPQPQRRPLIDYCTNDRHSNPPYASHPAPPTFADRFDDRMDSSFDFCVAVLQSRKFRRLFLSLTCFSIFTAVLWFTKLAPYVAETRAVVASLQTDGAGGMFGANLRPHFIGMTQLLTLDPDFLPLDSTAKHTDSRNKRRLLFIGDIHGCKKELVTLLDTLKFNSDTDHIITTGDMVSKGPDSLGVIDLLRQYGASCVRGNHEDRLILLTAQMSSLLQHNDSVSSPGGDSMDGQSFPTVDENDKQLARSLSSAQLEYLKSCPVILRVGELKSLGGEIVVVHAGLIPGIPFERQDPSSAMTMRSVDLSTHVPSRDYDRKGSVAWTKLWNRYQRLLPAHWTFFASQDPEQQKLKDMHTTVVYGHDSKRGLQIQKYTKGLDTGCVTGGKLTALVLTDGGKQNIKQVRCPGYRQQSPLESGAAEKE